jgi:hypothetical protein
VAVDGRKSFIASASPSTWPSQREMSEYQRQPQYGVLQKMSQFVMRDSFEADPEQNYLCRVAYVSIIRRF